LVFDKPRHKVQMHLPLDYPRINQFPEWFTVDADKTYRIGRDQATPADVRGRELLDGLPVTLTGGRTARLRVTT
jgi:hypothetical protein